MSLKPLILHSHVTGPNPWKVAIILAELGLPYETKYHEFTELKQEPFLKLSPNGRTPVLVDPNNSDFTLWESGAIIQYLVDKYDTEGKISYKGDGKERFLEGQWLHFQMSGQGPYYGQAAWFSHFHPESIPSARSRYIKEIARIQSVIDLQLSTSGTQYLVGDKCTYADLSFVTWHAMTDFILKGDKLENEGKVPKYEAWIKSMMERPAVKEVLAEKGRLMAKGH